MSRTKRGKVSVTPRLRVGLFTLGILALIGALWVKVFTVQYLQGEGFTKLAKQQQLTEEKLLGERGDIYFRDISTEERVVAAIDDVSYDVILNPKQIANLREPRKSTVKETIVTTLSRVVPDTSAEEVKNALSKEDDAWVRIAEDVDSKHVKQARNKDLQGVQFNRKAARTYPNDELGAHLLGYVSSPKPKTRKGKYGVEQEYQDVLQGKAGREKKRTTPNGFWVATRKKHLEKPRDGNDVVLTVDQNIQSKLEQTLKNVYTEENARQAFGAIMNPETGEIYAMAKQPTFNPNTYSEVNNINTFSNPIVNSIFEPGSIFKPLTMAVGLDTDTITPQTTYEDKGSVDVGEYTIENVVGARGTQTMTQVLENSLNTGTVFVENKVGHRTFRSYLRSFGLDRPTGVDLPGETTGTMDNLTSVEPDNLDNLDSEFATASFGKGISVTPIRMLTAFSAIVNDGKMPQPHVLKTKLSKEGEEQTPDLGDEKRIFSKETSQKLSKMLVSVVDNGFGENAAVEGYRVGGKTGTSQKLDESGEYTEDKTIHSFIEFATLQDSQYVMLLSVDVPQGQYANRTVVPPAGKLNRFLLNYFNMKPDRPSETNNDSD
jgi:cell division protein FtsI/penicillin-binding protein 2